MEKLFRSLFSVRQGVHEAQAVVEFTLATLFVILPLTFGLIEVGRGIWYYHQLSQLAREGARWLVVVDQYHYEDSSFPGLTAAGNAPATGSNVYGPSACLSGCDRTTVDHVRKMATGIPADQLTVTIARPALPGGVKHGLPVTVQAVYPYQPIVTSMLNIPATINLQAKSTMDLQ